MTQPVEKVTICFSILVSKLIIYCVHKLRIGNYELEGNTLEITR